MKRFKHLNTDLKTKLLYLLYQDEVMNVFLIHVIANEDLGELYIDDSYSCILHLKYDGNSYFTSFYASNRKALNKIALKLKKLKFDKILLAGNLKDVQNIMNKLSIKQFIEPNIYYRFDSKQLSINEMFLKSIRKATHSDIKIFRPFLIDFFEATADAAIKEITNPNKIEEELKTGIYLYKQDGEYIGMGRFSSFSKHYASITTIYIKGEHRNKGHGKNLMKCMIMTSLKMNKILVTQTSAHNTPARQTYESLGFIRIDDYAYEFIT